MKRLSELDVCHRAAITLFGVVCAAGAFAGLLLAGADGSGLSILVSSKRSTVLRDSRRRFAAP